MLTRKKRFNVRKYWTKKIKNLSGNIFYVYCLGKFCFTSHRPKCSCSIRLQDSLILDIFGRKTSV